MSTVIEIFLICDKQGCDNNFGVDNRHLTATQQRKSAKINGWIYSAGKDYCPDCRFKPKYKQGKK